MISALLALSLIGPTNAAELTFTEVSAQAGVALEHDFAQHYQDPVVLPVELKMGGGVAAGDFDRDGDTDLYVITGDAYPNALLRNNADGTFSDIAVEAGVALPGHQSTGPVFADIDADGWQDLLVGGLGGAGMKVFRNLGNGQFADHTQVSGIHKDSPYQNDFSTAFGDPDQDGDLDAFVTHWSELDPANHLWLNSGSGQFMPADSETGIASVYGEEDWGFAPTFADINGDGLQDILVAADYATSHHMLNRGDLVFEDTTSPLIEVVAGMGSAVADFDNDGDNDWFVTAIWWGSESTQSERGGNHLYLNNGDGYFSNHTQQSGTQQGSWGWSACSADFNNDGWLDIFHVNGMEWVAEKENFSIDLSRLFINQGEARFEEQSETAGMVDREQGRGVVCFDYDMDGDIDIFIANWLGPTRLFRNDINSGHWLQIQLQGEESNPHAVGARIELTAGGKTQTREVTIGSNYQSQNPLLQHFGLLADQVDELQIHWPHGGRTRLENVPAGQRLLLSAEQAQPAPFAVEPGISGAWFDPQHNGEGFVLEVLEEGLVVLYWFTYTPDGEQDWYVAVGETQGRRVLFPELMQVSGGVFGPGFDPLKVQRNVAGTAAFTWSGCGSGFMDWQLSSQARPQRIGRQQLTRLTSLGGLECDDLQPVSVNSAARSGSDQVAAEAAWGISGSWFDPSHDGEGFIVQELEGGDALVYWFSFDTQANRRWFFGVGEILQDRILFNDLLTAGGGKFGDQFDPAEVETPSWGQLELQLNCDSGTAKFSSLDESFPAGELSLQRLTRPGGLACTAQH